MTKEDLMEVFGTTLENSRGDHIITDCPFCGKKGHLYINHLKAFQTDNSGKYLPSWDCKKCSYNGNIYYLLKYINALHIIVKPTVNVLGKLKNLLIEEEIEEDEKLDLSMPRRKMPLGWKRIMRHEYLEQRGFTKTEFNKYKIGVTTRRNLLRNYIVVAIEDGGEVKGWLGRYGAEKIPKGKTKYQNSKRTDFSKLLLGYDELNFMTKTVIGVEGFFDKVAVDRALKLDSLDSTIKCCATFGKSFSKYQVEKLMLKGVQNLILGYDPDAISVMKKIGKILESHFDMVFAACDSVEFKDFGESSPKKIRRIFREMEELKEFKINKIYQKLS